MMIAAHATAHIPSNEPIDLINVAFTLDSEIDINNSNVPDRVTGRKGVQELAALYPERTWNFIEVDVTLTELYLHKEHIKTLCTPLSSVMDLSIASALWFASRGIGKLRRYTSDILSTSENYETPARILLVGIGADEQLGGYRKHRMVFHKGGWEALAEELQRGIQAISYRNLGRDDRVIGDHGREARFPFLDEDLVNFLSSVPVWLKADLRYPRGLGEKYLLRKAAWKVGMKNSAFMEKRAIQFGSRVAHLEKFMGKKLKNLL
ncbi:asparagine synthetase domain-containing protein 1-like isoform X1 [Zophobas morio]|uniref:asparagine synthetase domain-containing protein 1-like isoform X1 n=1 Tax=Zophobas morio TaxID=2755281 RepID=UPI003082DDAB